mmetsp:Transcript_68177/g.114617  ORF Transcript_68177/g.114617 Transcript_68177/m.114617 type:complete len:231 (-) Transcript_68177:137-829(-)
MGLPCPTAMRHYCCQDQRALCSRASRSVVRGPSFEQTSKRRPLWRWRIACTTTRATSWRRIMGGDTCNSSLWPTKSVRFGAKLSTSPQGFTMAMGMPEVDKKASACSFQNSTLPPANGFGLGSVVPMDEIRATKRSGWLWLASASARTWLITPSHSTFLVTSSEARPVVPTAMATESTPLTAPTKVSGFVTSPTKMPSAGPHFPQFSTFFASAGSLTKPRTWTPCCCSSE